MLVVGTAGHVDHGKTSLVRALTGVDLDDLPEEKARGITIALGFTSLALPDGRAVGLVDVPGHERLVRTMIAGATGFDAVLLCVSAVEGVMPQTREHVAILGLLGVTRGVVALTMADLVDDELLALAVEDVRALAEGTFLAGAPIVPVSSVDGRGLPALRAALAALPTPERRVDGPFRLPVDRVFVRPGFGVVVTGTVWSGRLRDGAAVTLHPGGLAARVRGIEVHGVPTAEALPGRRTALNLAGVDPERVSRGVVVTAGPVAESAVLDVAWRALGDVAEGDAIVACWGTTERAGRIWRAAPGPPERLADGPVQVRLDAPLPVLPGDGVVVRRPSPAETLGGGAVVDPWASKVRARDLAERAEDLRRLAAGDRSVWLEHAGEAGLGATDLALRGIPDRLGVRLGDRAFDPAVAQRLGGLLVEALAGWHAAHPLSPGAPRRDLRRDRLAGLPERVFDGLLDRLSADGRVTLDGPLVRLPDHRVVLDAGAAALRDGVVAALAEAGLEGRSDAELASLGADAPALVRLIAADGLAAEVPGVGWVLRARLDDLIARVREHFATAAELGAPEFKALAGLTRRTAIPLLEWLDRQRVTRRLGDRRVLRDG